MVARELARDITTILEQPCADVALELTATEKLRDGTGGLSSPDLELKETIARRRVALGEEEIVLVLGVDVRNAQAVAQNLDRLPESVGAECVGPLRTKHRRNQARR